MYIHTSEFVSFKRIQYSTSATVRSDLQRPYSHSQLKGVNRTSGSGSVKGSVRLDLIGSIVYRCRSPWRSKMDLGPIRSVQWSVTMHSNGTMPLPLSLPLDAPLDAAADARCVHSLRVFLHSTGFVPVKLGNGSVGGLVNSAVADKWFYSNFNWTFTWERALQTIEVSLK